MLGPVHVVMVLQPEVVLVPPSPVLVPPLADDEAEWVVGGAHQGVLVLRAAAAARRPGQAEVAVVGSGVRQLLPVDVRHRGGCRRLSIMLKFDDLCPLLLPIPGCLAASASSEEECYIFLSHSLNTFSITWPRNPLVTSLVT